MTIARTAVLLVAGVALALTSPALAQTESEPVDTLDVPNAAVVPGTSRACLEQAARTFVPKSPITVFRRSGPAQFGELISIDVSRNALTLEQYLGEGTGFRRVNIRAEEISRMEFQPDKGIGRKAVFGGLLGAGLAVVAASVFIDSEPGPWIGGLLLGGGIGAWIGYELQEDPTPVVVECPGSP